VPSIRTDLIYPDSEIEPGTILYRITSATYADPAYLLNGRGALLGEGRFHRIQQLTSSISQNILVCFSEQLFYMSRSAIRKLSNNSFVEFRREAVRDCLLAIVECNQQADLIHIASATALHHYSLNPSSITQPDQCYTPLQDAADRIRSSSKEGLVYLSARHSVGLAAALFGDKTGLIKSIIATVRVRLSLVSEDRSQLVGSPSFNPTKDRISYSMGHFSIDAADFANYQYKFTPVIAASQGYLSFNRIPYKGAYPRAAIT
jgi:RES domain